MNNLTILLKGGAFFTTTSTPEIAQDSLEQIRKAISDPEEFRFIVTPNMCVLASEIAGVYLSDPKPDQHVAALEKLVDVLKEPDDDWKDSL